MTDTLLTRLRDGISSLPAREDYEVHCNPRDFASIGADAIDGLQVVQHSDCPPGQVFIMPKAAIEHWNSQEAR